MNGKIIATKLHSIENGILGALGNPEIQDRLSEYGYTPERIEEGRALLDAATSLMAAQVEEYGDQYSATGELGKRWRAIYAKYIVTVKVARVAFKTQHDQLARFNAIGKRNRSLSGWLRDARILYTNLLNSPDALDVMARFGYSGERLREDQQEVNAVEELHSRQLGEKGEAQQATLDRDNALDNICDWYSDFRAIARVALYEKPQLLEALGIVKKVKAKKATIKAKKQNG
jgi:hypothetical protein